ncbi:hypothetical protein BGX38DRAFT_608581 [Terfezia claveryi]|nr:hypothetical protein BGX38DRAFT_608581 [Terfezia claveryi]
MHDVSVSFGSYTLHFNSPYCRKHCGQPKATVTGLCALPPPIIYPTHVVHQPAHLDATIPPVPPAPPIPPVPPVLSPLKPLNVSFIRNDLSLPNWRPTPWAPRSHCATWGRPRPVHGRPEDLCCPSGVRTTPQLLASGRHPSASGVRTTPFSPGVRTTPFSIWHLDDLPSAYGSWYLWCLPNAQAREQPQPLWVAYYSNLALVVQSGTDGSLVPLQ